MDLIHRRLRLDRSSAASHGGDGPWLLLGLAIGLMVIGVAIVVAKRLVTRAYLRINGDSLSNSMPLEDRRSFPEPGL